MQPSGPADTINGPELDLLNNTPVRHAMGGPSAARPLLDIATKGSARPTIQSKGMRSAHSI
jgi:hypothetical protein